MTGIPNDNNQYNRIYGTGVSSDTQSSQPGASQDSVAFTPPASFQSPSSQPDIQFYSSVASAQQKQGKGWIVGIVVIVAICLVLLAGIVSCNSAMSNIGESLSPFGTSTESNKATESAIVVIDIDGTIQYDGTTCSPEGLKSQLDRAENDPNVEGVILRVNSGGGTATAGEEMSIYVREFSKPIVVSSAATNASAAYEISSQADYIFTARTTSIGAIGVALEVTDLSGLYEKLGIRIDAITSSESKDASYGNRPLTEEERAWYQRIVDQISDDFINTVAEGRNMDVDEVKLLANGLPYTGEDAVKNGLADEIGTFDDALAYVSALAGFHRTLPVMYYRDSSSDLITLLNLLSESSDLGDKVEVSDLVKELKEQYGE